MLNSYFIVNVLEKWHQKNPNNHLEHVNHNWTLGYLDWNSWENICESMTYNEKRKRECNVADNCNPKKLEDKRNIQNCDENGACNSMNNACECNDGYEGDGFSCSDIDECSIQSHNCDSNANCFNKIGSFECICKTGFDGDGVICHDIDECYTNIHNCDVEAVCTNSIGSYTCQCIDGFSGDGLTCFDVNECDDLSHGCDAHANCFNSYGSFECVCNSGFDGDGFTCHDIDECYTNIHNCDVEALCTNSIGSYTCQCIDGYSGNGFSCSDVNECEDLTHGCDQQANCFNSHGSYECVCNSGYDGDGLTCHDIDECYTNIHNCDEKAICTNAIGSYTCQCLDGFTGSGFGFNSTEFAGDGCFDIDECENNSHTCDINANCDNTFGGYTCHCRSDLIGDGFECLEPIFQNKSILLLSTYESTNVPMVISMNGKSTNHKYLKKIISFMN